MSYYCDMNKDGKETDQPVYEHPAYEDWRGEVIRRSVLFFVVPVAPGCTALGYAILRSGWWFALFAIVIFSPGIWYLYRYLVHAEERKRQLAGRLCTEYLSIAGSYTLGSTIVLWALDRWFPL